MHASLNPDLFFIKKSSKKPEMLAKAFDLYTNKFELYLQYLLVKRISKEILFYGCYYSQTPGGDLDGSLY